MPYPETYAEWARRVIDGHERRDMHTENPDYWRKASEERFREIVELVKVACRVDGEIASDYALRAADVAAEEMRQAAAAELWGPKS